VSRDDPLGRDDFVAHWTTEAREHAKQLQWASDQIPEVVAILEETFGADWLRSKAEQPSRYTEPAGQAPIQTTESSTHTSVRNADRSYRRSQTRRSSRCGSRSCRPPL
jgi:hypothetical protein